MLRAVKQLRTIAASDQMNFTMVDFDSMMLAMLMACQQAAARAEEEKRKREAVDRMRREIRVREETEEAKLRAAVSGVALVVLTTYCAWCAVTRCRCTYVTVRGTKSLRQPACCCTNLHFTH